MSLLLSSWLPSVDMGDLKTTDLLLSIFFSDKKSWMKIAFLNALKKLLIDPENTILKETPPYNDFCMIIFGLNMRKIPRRI